MATTPTFGWPTPDDTDLVRDGAAAIRAFGDAVDASATALEFSQLVAVKHALKTDTFSSSVSGGGNVAVPGLSITHELSDSSNLLIISAFFGVAANNQGRGQVGLAVHDGTGLIAIGDVVGSRTSVTAGGDVVAADLGSTEVVTMPSVTFVHAPGSGSKTYTVRAINIRPATQTLYINRNENDPNNERIPRGASGLVIQEVKP